MISEGWGPGRDYSSPERMLGLCSPPFGPMRAQSLLVWMGIMGSCFYAAVSRDRPTFFGLFQLLRLRAWSSMRLWERLRVGGRERQTDKESRVPLGRRTRLAAAERIHPGQGSPCGRRACNGARVLSLSWEL